MEILFRLVHNSCFFSSQKTASSLMIPQSFSRFSNSLILSKISTFEVSEISPARIYSSRIEYTCIMLSRDLDCYRCTFFSSAHTLFRTSHLIEIENDVELTDITEVFVEKLHKEVDCFQVSKFIVIDVHGNSKEQAGVSTINQLVVHELQGYRQCSENPERISTTILSGSHSPR